jgi:hydroxyethylthiazole kinase-like uncharacterized protein yjeF
MTELLTAAQMRAIEQAAIASGEVTGLELMECAGRGVVEAILEWRPELATAPHKAVVLCGPGNNGGDGFVVARLLRERGWEVEVFLYGDETKLPPDAAENCRRWREMGEVRSYVDNEFHLPPEDWRAGSLIVDALFGTGLTRPVEGFDEFGWATQMSGWRIGGGVSGYPHYPESMVVAVDIPSGLCADSGRYLRSGDNDTRREYFCAHLTVTFHSRKLGHVLEDGPEACGEVRIVDIGLGAVKPPGVVEETVRPSSPLSKIRSHKYAHGHAVVLSGGVGKGGAARLAARGALRVGAGLVTLCPPPAAIIENAAQLNAIMLRPVADAAALTELLEDKRFNAVGLGPGLGVGERTAGLVAATLAAKRGSVLDADALTSFAGDPAKLFALLHRNCVLTPHMGEFARLFPDLAAKLAEPATRGPAYSKVDAAREAAARAGCVVLLKGADTVIADPEGRASINSAHYDRATPWLATAGAGDVLTGMIAGLLARGFAPMAAAETAAWLHVECARKFGPGLIAEDLPEMLPAVFRDLGL